MAQHSENEEEKEEEEANFSPGNIFQERSDQSCVWCWTVVPAFCYLDVYLCLMRFFESHSCLTEVE